MPSVTRSRLSLVLGSLLVSMLAAGLVGAPAGAEQAGSATGRVAAASVDAGDGHTCAVSTTGAVRCWGLGFFGELGHDSRASVGDGGTDRSIADAGDVPLGGSATAITAGDNHTCALLSTGAVRCWGYGFYGQLGHDSSANVGDGGTDQSIAAADDVPLGGRATAITAGANHTCALLTTGAVRCWGQGFDGQLGHDTSANIGDGGIDESIKTADDVPLGGNATAITAGIDHTCALLTKEAVRCWGNGGSGQLGHDRPANVGDGGTDESIEKAGDVPVGVAIRVRAATRVTAGVTPKRDRHAPYVYALRGRIKGAFVTDSATCTGQVKITVRKGTKVLRTRTVNVDSSCRYHARVRLSAADLPLHRAARLPTKIHYVGTTNLTASNTTRRVTAH
jgi:hypothetical protein